jgi:hypothetical protein
MSMKATCLSKLNILYMAVNTKTIMNFNYTASFKQNQNTS